MDMIYIHRAEFSNSVTNDILPLDYHYMGSSEFELGGILSTYRYLEGSKECVVEGRRIRLRKWRKFFFDKGPADFTLTALGGCVEDVRKTLDGIEEYYENRASSKEWIKFGKGNFTGKHPVGIDIENKTIVSIHPGFITFVKDLISTSGLIGRRPDSRQFKVREFVNFFDVESQTYHQGWVVKDHPAELLELVVSDGKKRKKRVSVNCVTSLR